MMGFDKQQLISLLQIMAQLSAGLMLGFALIFVLAVKLFPPLKLSCVCFEGKQHLVS